MIRKWVIADRENFDIWDIKVKVNKEVKDSGFH